MFKVGDKVRCIDPYAFLKGGGIYIISDIVEKYGDTYLKLYDTPSPGTAPGYFPRRFELVQEKEEVKKPKLNGLTPDLIIFDELTTQEESTKATHPSHYSCFSIEPIDFISANNLGFREGCIIKYACRWDKKGTPKEDLEKIIYYAQHLLKEFKEAKEAK